MRLFLQEMKKIWRLPILVVIAVVTAMYGYMFLGFYISYSSLGALHGSTDYYTALMLADLQEEYGQILEPHERIDAEKFFGIYSAQIDEFIIGNPKYEREGIFNAWDLWEREKELRNPPGSEDWGEYGVDERWAESEAVYFPWENEFFEPFRWGEYRVPSNHALLKMTALDYLFYLYDWHDNYGAVLRGADKDEFDIVNRHFTGWDENENEVIWISEKEMAQLRSQHTADPRHNLFSGEFFERTMDFYTNLVVIVLIAVGILLLPLITRDRQRNMIAMQWSSKKGREILRIQFAAVMTSAFVLATGIVGGFTTVFLTANADVFGIFYNQRVATWTVIPWFDFTFMQFIVIFIAVIMVFALGAAALFFFLSVYSRDYVQLLLKGVPVGALMAIIGTMTVNKILIGDNQLYRIVPIFKIEFVVSGVVLAIGIGLGVFACIRAMRKDLL
jgi:hypothetical protein